MDTLEPDVNCLVCFQPMSSLEAPKEFPPDFLQFYIRASFLNHKSDHFHLGTLEGSSLCVQCCDNLSDLVDTLKEIERLQGVAIDHNKHFKTQLLVGYNLSQSQMSTTQFGVTPRVLDKYYESRCSLIEGLRLRPDLPTEFPLIKIEATDFCQVELQDPSSPTSSTSGFPAASLFIESSPAKEHEPPLSSKPKKSKKSTKLEPIDPLDPEKPETPPEDPPIGPEFKCSECGVVKKSFKDLEIHEMIHTGETPFVCDICGGGYRSDRLLRRHLQNHREMAQPRNFACNLCSKAFPTSGRLNIHMKNHTGVNRQLCQLCGTSYANKLVLEEHMKKAHLGISLTTECEICHKFVSNKYYKDHKRIHMGNQKYPCTEPGCLSRFNKNSELRLHISSVHRKERKYMCTACPKQFLREDALRAHQRVHNEEKLYKCSICQKAFNKPDVMKRHEKTHEKDKVNPFICDTCGKSFVLRDYLSQHMSRTKCGK